MNRYVIDDEEDDDDDDDAGVRGEAQKMKHQAVDNSDNSS